ncbi:DNA-binding MarR family transcriptional regulator [Rhodococcus sp. LBL1]|nr:DNA-binding MarR family transcriptional regulator [Rhodococcus sp. LBL1]MDH6681745.1 DNA-binding MarR family transcriptional regulator [Rhodococcus sp. LBL2]
MPMTSDPELRRELELSLGEQINALISATRALSEQSAAAFHDGLQPAAFHIARWLHAFGPARPSAAAEAVRMDRSSTSTQIGRMRALGLIVSKPDPQDRRGVVVELSAEGHARVSATLSERGAYFFDRLTSWSDTDIRQLTQLIERLVSG